LTLGPLAGPAVRFWLYRSAVDDLAELHSGILSVTLAFSSGLIGWVLAVLLATSLHLGTFGLIVLSAPMVLGVTMLARWGVAHWKRFAESATGTARALDLALIGWIDWLLAGAAFIACVHATRLGTATPLEMLRTFYLGQGIGLVSFVPGGLGSSDAFWVAHLPIAKSAAAAALMAYRLIYYVGPWAVASLLLLSWVSRRTTRRLELARRIVASLVGGGGLLMLISSASPALQARLPLMRQMLPLGLVEASVMTAAFAGLLLVVLARGLARGYRAAFRATMILLTLACVAAIMKGLDWEEASILLLVAFAARSQASLFDRLSHGHWLDTSDLVLAFAALSLFVLFGTFSFHLSTNTLARWTEIGYHLQATRFVRAAAALTFALAATTAWVFMRAPRRFEQLPPEEMDRTLALHAKIGSTTNPMLVATGDKEVFVAGDFGFCLYRTLGPYMFIFSDPVVRLATDRPAFLDALFAFAAEIDRRPAFYQISPEWMPALHDRGYDFFKVGEEAMVPLAPVTLTGSAGKLNRQFLKRAERDGIIFRIIERDEVTRRMAELEDVSREWLQAREGVERQFSVGFFDAAYLSRFRCAVVEDATGRLLGFANLFEGPRLREFSIDLMRYRATGPSVMDFMIVSLLLEGQRLGYARFNLGMAPLAEVGARRDAHRRERVAYFLFRRGEQWYNFQGLRFFKQKFNPEWQPRYMAYQNTWEWLFAAAYLGALTTGGWKGLVAPARASKADA
ncbi:MAG: phosphatidylglycerol lysyltransferase domain-containing protein, partial [Acidobacteriota bacterium]